MFNVGRRVTNDITVSDISVSRQQALMKYDSVRNCIYLEDCDSKFGTFKKINGLYPIDQVD
jgi:pSer/pThr/pTyr-binding forkhead associated (FHA) protein